MSAALLLVAAVGFAGVFWQWRQAEANLAESDRNRSRALDSAHQAHMAINDLFEIGNDPLLDRSDLIDFRRKLWQTGVQYYRVFLEQADNDPRFTEPLLRTDTAFAQGSLASLLQHLGLATEAEAAYAKAENLWQRLLDEEPQNENYQLNLVRIVSAHGLLWRIQGRLGEAAAAFHQVIRELSNHQSRGPLSDDDDVDLLMSVYIGLGDLQEKQGQLREAENNLEQARIIGEDYLNKRPDSVAVRASLLGVYNALVMVEQYIGHTELALKAHRRGVEIGQRLLELAPNVPSHGLQLAHYHFALGSIHGGAGRHEQALRAYQQTERLLVSVLQQDPAHFGARYLQAQSRYSCCIRLHDLGRLNEAVDACRQAHRLMEQLVRDQPSNPDIHDFLAKVCFWLAKVSDKTGQKAEALAAWQQGAEVSGRLARLAPDEPRWRFRQGTCLHCLASMHQDMNRLAEAADIFRRAAALRESACQDAPNCLTYHADTSGTWRRLGELEERLGHAEEALKAYQHSLERQRAATDERHRIAYQPYLRRSLGDNIRMLKKLGRDKEAAAMTAVLNAIPISSETERKSLK